MAKPLSQSHITIAPPLPEPAFQEAADSRKKYLVRLLRIAQYITTTPWQNLNIAAQQMIDIHNETEQGDIIMQWAKDKQTEFKYVSLAGTIVASAVTGSIQWPQSTAAHWTVLAAWYGSLLLSLFCIIIAFHLSILIATYTARSDGAAKLLLVVKRTRKHKPSFTGLFVLQVPMMLLSYSIISYIVGLIVLVMEPLWRQAWAEGDQGKVAVFFGCYLVFASGVYVVVGSAIYGKFLPGLEWEGRGRGVLGGRTMRVGEEGL